MVLTEMRRSMIRRLLITALATASLLAVPAVAQASQAHPAAASAAPALLAAPGSLHARTSPHHASLTWGAVRGAAAYELRITPAGGHGTGTTRFDRPLSQRAASVVLSPGRYVMDVRAGQSVHDVHGHWSPWLAFTVPSPAPAAGSSMAARAFAWALAQAGKPYIWGGTGPYGFDCSGLVMMAYEHVGINLPRTTYGMLGSGLLHWTNHPVKGSLAFYGSGHVELFAGGDETWGAHDSGSLIGLIQEWEAPEYFNVA
jgi:cell wall-associated NlpC family hydrolase